MLILLHYQNSNLFHSPKLQSIPFTKTPIYSIHQNSNLFHSPKLQSIPLTKTPIYSIHQNSNLFHSPKLQSIPFTKTPIYSIHQNSNLFHSPKLQSIPFTKTPIYSTHQNSNLFHSPKLQSIPLTKTPIYSIHQNSNLFHSPKLQSIPFTTYTSLQQRIHETVTTFRSWGVNSVVQWSYIDSSTIPTPSPNHLCTFVWREVDRTPVKVSVDRNVDYPLSTGFLHYKPASPLLHYRPYFPWLEVLLSRRTAPRSPYFVRLVDGQPLTGHGFLTSNYGWMMVLQTLVTEKQPPFNLNWPSAAVGHTIGKTTNTLTHLMLYYTEKRPNHNLMYTVDNTFSYCSKSSYAHVQNLLRMLTVLKTGQVVIHRTFPQTWVSVNGVMSLSDIKQQSDH